MKKLLSLSLALLLFCGSLLPQGDVEELFKIPYLIQHYYQEHSNQAFLDFLAEHYGNGTNAQVHQQADQDHQKLPLKQHDHQGLQIFNFLPSFWSATLTSSETPRIDSFLDSKNLYHFIQSSKFLRPPELSNHSSL